MPHTHVTLTQDQDYRFAIDFGNAIPLTYSDEPEPLGKGSGPTPSQLLVAAVANCLSDSLLFALRKFKQNPEPIRTEAHAEIGRNTENRLRILSITVDLHLGVRATELAHLDRVLTQFEAFCTVSQSVGAGIPLKVAVYDREGIKLK